MVILGAFWAGYTWLNDRSLNPLPLLGSICLTEARENIHDSAGVDFRVEYTSCDTLAKDEAIRVFAERPVDIPVLGKWLKKKTLLFRYDPEEDLNPTITIPQSGRVVIAVPRLSSIAMQKRHWNGWQIDYEIGHIDYP
jgi:hypothetical protein